MAGVDVERCTVHLPLPPLPVLLLPVGHGWASGVEGEMMVMTKWCWGVCTGGRSWVNDSERRKRVAADLKTERDAEPS